MDQQGIGGLIKFCCSVLHVLVLIVATPIVQRILNKTTISLPSATMYPCNAPFAELDSDTSIAIPGAFGAEIQPYVTILSTDSADSAGRVLKKQLGSSMFPDMKLKRGVNPVDFSARVTLADTQTLLNDFILPMFTENKSVKLYLDVANVSVKLFGFLTIPDLHMHKVLVCQGKNITKSKQIPSQYCNPSAALTQEEEEEVQDLNSEVLWRRMLEDSNQGYEILCTADSNFSTIVV